MLDSSLGINDDRLAVRASRSLASVFAGTGKEPPTMAESELFERGLQARRDVSVLSTLTPTSLTPTSS